MSAFKPKSSSTPSQQRSLSVASNAGPITKVCYLPFAFLSFLPHCPYTWLCLVLCSVILEYDKYVHKIFISVLEY